MKPFFYQFMNKNTKKAIQYLLFFLLGIYLLYSVFTNPDINLKEVWKEILSIQWIWVGVSLFIGFLAHISRASRWKLLLDAAGYNPKLLNVYNAKMAGYFTNTAIPRAGEFVRCGLVKKSDNIPFTTAFGTATVERLVDMITLFSLIFIAFFSQYELINGFFDENIFTPIKEKATTKNLLIAGGILALIIYMLSKSEKKIEKAVEKKGNGSLDEMVDDVWDGLKSITKLKKIPLFVFHSLFIWLGYFGINYFIFIAFDLPQLTTWQVGLGVLVVGSVSKMLPTQAHGAGTFHAFVSSFLLIYNVDLNLAVAIATVIHGSQFLFYVIGGGISYVWITFFTENNFVESEETEIHEG